ncbi:hypothetical protein HCN44_005497 [Aphidius gifuensis]|uniref:Large ribosomal subunit protein mL46 n=1 Tax=Aphidius gifuensis TaxID=684658 RepID=A0A835CY26_APHGI|nr:39S ribosomal protein L46, mitochondrial [Aphidius gifuensis]KAF7997220.1 hypothetical protein HCN44_005497 [Aphidius gifuensis]
MLIQVLKWYKASSPAVISNLLRYQVASMSTGVQEKKWDLMTAICVERHPILTKPKLEIEEKFQDMLDEIELENSMKSDHEIRFEAETKQQENLKKGFVDIDQEKVATQTAQDIEDAGIAEFEKFKLTPRLTEADKKNIMTSLERKLEKTLVLLVQQKVGNKDYWLLPQGLREDGETLRQAAERVLQKTCGENLKAKIYGNAPVGFYKYRYPKVAREGGTQGAKIFYYLARYEDGNVTDNVDYQWLDRQELEKNLPKEICKSVTTFLIKE